MRKRILLQFPEGLSNKVVEIAEKLKDFDVFIVAEPCYGACDLKLHYAKLLKCDKVLHLCHTKLVESDVDVDYVILKEDVDVTFVEEFSEEIREKRIGICSPVQYVHLLGRVKSLLEKKGKEVLLGSGNATTPFLFPGQILGCNYSQALCLESKVDCYLVLSSGKFHAVGLALKTEKPVYLADIERRRIEKVDASKIKKKIELAKYLILKEARRVGIVISVKEGQFKPELAYKVKEYLERAGKKCVFLVMDFVNPEFLNYIKGIDGFVNTACPRIGIDDLERFDKPVVNAETLLSSDEE
jgi:2-(3-amino-3-carboxypropyl)histidine synthase